MLLLIVAQVVKNVREYRAGQVHERRGLRAQHQLVDRPRHRGGRGQASDLFGQSDAEPLALLSGPKRLLERFADGDGVGLRVEGRWVAVGFGEGIGQRALGLARGLGE